MVISARHTSPLSICPFATANDQVVCRPQWQLVNFQALISFRGASRPNCASHGSNRMASSSILYQGRNRAALIQSRPTRCDMRRSRIVRCGSHPKSNPAIGCFSICFSFNSFYSAPFRWRGAFHDFLFFQERKRSCHDSKYPRPLVQMWIHELLLLDPASIAGRMQSLPCASFQSAIEKAVLLAKDPAIAVERIGFL